MTKPKSASEWLEEIGKHPRFAKSFPAAHVVLAMLRDAKAEMAMLEACLELVDIRPAEHAPKYHGWSAIEAKWKSGGYG